MKRQYEIGEVAHLAKGMRVNGILNYNTEKEGYKKLTLKFQDSVKIINHKRIDVSYGGYGYDCEVEKDGVAYRIENIAQNYLYSKEMWQKNVELEEKIKELEQQLRNDK